jgi:UDP-N-acetylmuramoylalanine--D-glutamate ligase
MKVAIAGYGIEGEASYRYYVARGDDVTILDERETLDRSVPNGAQTILGDHAFDDLDRYDIVLRTPALPPYRLKTARKVWSVTNEFFDQCPAPIVGVTGTKGKGTTCSLIASILRAGGYTVHLVGNIGTPALDVLATVKPDDIVVYELSSFQLWDITKSPSVAVLLMIEPDHLDVHRDFQEYIDAKSNIIRYQQPPDVTIWNAHNEYADQIAKTYGAILAPYLTPLGAYIQDGHFWFRQQELCAVTTLQLPGMHNVENACAAITASWYVMHRDDVAFFDAVKKGLSDFSGLPHRLKFVSEVDGVKYYDDSIATTPGSAIAALRAFDEPTTIILGGSDKGAEYDSIVQVCREKSAQVIAIGKTGAHIADLCRHYGVSVVRETGMMREVVAVARNTAVAGGVVILSPASASFDQYKSYSDRGDQFVAAVGEL